MDVDAGCVLDPSVHRVVRHAGQVHETTYEGKSNEDLRDWIPALADARDSRHFSPEAQISIYLRFLAKAETPELLDRDDLLECSDPEGKWGPHDHFDAGA